MANLQESIRLNLIFYILNIPNRVSFVLGRFPVAIFKPMPRKFLVCAGAIIPSSQSRADEKTASLSLSIRDFSSGSTFLPTASMTALSWAGPMTPVLAAGQTQRKRGEYARPHIP